MGFNISNRWRIQTKDRNEANDPPADLKNLLQSIEDRANGAAQIVANAAARNAIPAGELYPQKRVVELDTGTEYRRIGSDWQPHMQVLDLTANAQVYGNWDGSAGLNSLGIIGPFRVVNFAMYQDAGYAIGDGLFQVGGGHKPGGNAWAGGALEDVSVRGNAGFRMDSSGYVTLHSFTADNGADGRIKSLRGTFFYPATH